MDNEFRSYAVKLDTFEGPLDLLLHLVAKHEMDINDIPMAQITAQYLAYLAQMELQNIDIASEFLVMAATLVHIKSKMLLPAPALEQVENEEIDPRVELVHRLLEYQRYKDGAQQLAQYPQLERDVFVRPDIIDVAQEKALPVIEAVGEVGLFELVKALQGLLARVDEPHYHDVYKTDFTVSIAIEQLLTFVDGRDHVPFLDCFGRLPKRSEVVVMFLAVLELVKLHMCKIVQLTPHGTIYIYAVKS